VSLTNEALCIWHTAQNINNPVTQTASPYYSSSSYRILKCLIIPWNTFSTGSCSIVRSSFMIHWCEMSVWIRIINVASQQDNLETISHTHTTNCLNSTNITSIDTMYSNTTINICIAKRCFYIAGLNNDMFRPLYQPSSGCTFSYFKANCKHTVVFVFLSDISCTSVKSVFKINTVTVELPYFPTDNAHPKLFYIPFEVQITRT
jgi:hypothetical protein